MDSQRARGLPPKLGIKKRKPRASSIIDVANGRARKNAPQPAVAPGGQQYQRSEYPVGRTTPGRAPVARLAKQQQPPTSAKGSRTGSSAGGPDSDVKRKGLRHFAVRVSRKVEEKSVTTYNEVADELVVEEKEIKQQEVEAGGKAAVSLQKKLAKSGSLVDEKNIRRRVYDSLNVLMAMGIIEKDKKLISWRGLAMARGGGGQREAAATREAITERRRAVEEKRALFLELEHQATTLAALIRRNAKSPPSIPLPPAPEDESRGGIMPMQQIADADGMLVVSNAPGDATGNVVSGESRPGGPQLSATPSTSGLYASPDRIPIPFIVVATGVDSQIEMEIDQEREDVTLTFSSAFAVFDDREVLRRMNMAAILPQG